MNLKNKDELRMNMVGHIHDAAITSTINPILAFMIILVSIISQAAFAAGNMLDIVHSFAKSGLKSGRYRSNNKANVGQYFMHFIG